MLPLTIIVFGATGDLFKKKLTRAFFDIIQKKYSKERYTIIGISRKHLSHNEFRDFAKQVLSDLDTDLVNDFLEHLYYYSIDATDIHSLVDLRDILDRVDQGFGITSNKLFYIATLPSTYELIFKNISQSGLSLPCLGSNLPKKPWVRIIVEKPFGSDLSSAVTLDTLLGESFKEEQIYRIDHYLAKETVQAIYAFRFDNILFGDIWNKDHIERVEIFAYEDEKKDSIESRKAFYDGVGALKDFGQNHLLELLSLILMQKPSEGDVRKERARALSLVSLLEANLVFGQYEGYRTEGFEHSKVETYFKVVLNIQDDVWQDVPFIIEHGKMLHETKTGISVFFKSKEGKPNVIRFCIQPESIICVDLNITNGESKQMCFSLGEENQFIYPYEKLLLDALDGDQTLFVSTNEVKESWRIVEEIERVYNRDKMLVYKKGPKPEEIN
jgi:glucose-6-phosphate 1-dehydrogenase